MLQLGDQLAALVAGIELQIDLAHALTPSLPFGAQLVETLDAENGTRPACFDALADPDFFFLEQLVGAGVGQAFLVQLRFLAHAVFLEAARVTGQFAAIELDDARTHAVKKGTVVGDEEQGGVGFDQQVFQPLDGRNIEVVGRLVEEQHLGRHGQRLGQRQTLLLAAGQTADIGFRVESETVDDPLRLRLVGPRTTGFKLVLQGFHAIHQRLVITRAFGHLMRHFMVGGKQLGGLPHAGGDRLKDGLTGI